MGKATSMLFAAIGFGTASYLMFVPDMDQAASEKLASLMRIAAEGTRAVPPTRPERDPTHTQTRPRLIADNETSLATGDQGRINLAQAPNTERGQVAPTTAGTADAGQRRSTVRPVDEDARRQLSRSIQAELKRVGCFDGEPDGVWNTPTRNALKIFIDRINATLPVNEPDYILLTLLQGHTNRVCGKGCPTGQLLANDGRCQPKVIVAQAERKLPRRDPKPDNADSGQRTVASAQVAPDVFERERQAQVKAAEEARAKLAMEEARRRQQQLAKAEADRAAKVEADRVAQSVAAAAEDARRRQAALAEQQRQQEDTQRVTAARAADQQRMQAETALADARRKQAALEEQQRARTEAERRAADEQRIKIAAAAEDARRKQLVAEDQKRSKAEAERLAAARAEEEARVTIAAAAEEVRRKQLVADEQKRRKADAERLAADRAEDEARVKVAAAAEDARRKRLIADQKAAASTPAANDPARVAAASAPIMQPQIPSNVVSNSATTPLPPIATASEPVPFTTGSTAAATDLTAQTAPVLPNAEQQPRNSAQRERVVRTAPRRQNEDPQPRAQPRYVQQFVPPPYYVGRVQPPAPAPRPVYYQAPNSGRRDNIFHQLSRSAP